MNRLLAARKKSRDAWNKLEENPTHTDDVISYRTSDVTQGGVDVSSQRKELAQFLLQRKVRNCFLLLDVNSFTARCFRTNVFYSFALKRSS